MIDFVLLSLPVFGVVAIGWLALRLGLLPPASLDALGGFSFRFALPALVFRLIGAHPLSESFDAVFYVGYLGAGGLVFVAMVLISRHMGNQPPTLAAAHATAATVSNLGFLGPPLMLAFFGERGAGPLAMAILAEVTILLPLGGVLMGASPVRKGGVASMIIRGTLLNPVVLGILLGAAFAASGQALPDPIDRFLSFLGAAAGPTALFALGGALAIQRIERSTVETAARISIVKLVIYPGVVWIVLSAVLGAETFWVQTGVLIASLPTAGSVYVLAQRYDTDAEGVSSATVLATVLSLFSVPLTAWLILH